MAATTIEGAATLLDRPRVLAASAYDSHGSSEVKIDMEA
jgi:hypothetical protein